ncbi:MAG: GIY-YIG nuclease family protein [Eggerthellaceae bacterium]|nr:GIY-YIG nuclease family protein [Eggerthellaceae bacterium]
MDSSFVYIMASKRNGTLYVGVTSDLSKRAYEHKHETIPGFSREHKTKYLVYFEETLGIEGAITREKQLKGWTRNKKIALIEKINPGWDDLAAGFFS